MGPPAAGKGTQSKFLEKKYGLMHFSTGDELRAEINSASPLGQKVKSVMDAGQLVSDEIIMDLIKDRLGRAEYQKGIIFDGVVRTIPQAKGLDIILKERNEHITAAIDLQVEEKILVDRVQSRVAETIARGESPRSDDDLDTLRRRIREYKDFSSVVGPYYAAKGLLREIDGTQSMDDIAKTIEDIVSVDIQNKN